MLGGWTVLTSLTSSAVAATRSLPKTSACPLVPDAGLVGCDARRSPR